MGFDHLFDLLEKGQRSETSDGFPAFDIVRDADDRFRVTLAVLDKLGIARFVIGGNSLGGAVAWRTALAHPARVDKLILVDAGGYPQQPSAIPIGMRILRIPGLSWLMQHTLPRSLVEEGFRVETLYGWFDHRPYEDGEDQIWVCRRPG